VKENGDRTEDSLGMMQSGKKIRAGRWNQNNIRKISPVRALCGSKAKRQLH
jgi:hypothetical protein